MTIDRFEGNFCILVDETGQTHEVRRTLLPESAREGDVFSLSDGILHFDRSATEQARRRIEEKMKRLWNP